MGTEQEDEAGQGSSQVSDSKRKRDVWWFKQRHPIDRFTGWLVAWTALLFVATIINAAILFKTDITLHESLEATNRAWIAITGPVLVSAPSVGQPLQFYLQYKNSGQSPALDLNYHMEIGRSVFSADRVLPLLKGDICNKVPFPGGYTLFPGDSSDISFPDNNRTKVDADILSGAATFVWVGCFRYKTYNKARRTRFCYWLEENGGRWSWQGCGVEAD